MRMPTVLILLAALMSTFITEPTRADDTVADLKAKIAELQAEVDAHNAERTATKRHLEIFDELDLVAFNERDMERIGEIHAEDVKVYNPDGSLTTPFEPHHAGELQFLFDTFEFRVAEHIVGFGYGEWTAGVSVSKGKWVKPITLPDGRVLQPSHKELTIRIATLARWCRVPRVFVTAMAVRSG